MTTTEGHFEPFAVTRVLSPVRGLLLFVVAIGPFLVLLAPAMLGGDALDDTLGVLAGLQFALEDAGLPKGSSVFLTVYVASFASPFVVTRYMRRRYAVCELRLDGLVQRGAGMTYVARVPAARVARYTQTPFGYEIEVRGRNRLLAFLLPILVPADSDELRARVEPVLVSFYQGAEPPEATAGRTGA